MNDMRLPGLGLLSSETTPNAGSADAPRDPAQAFDAVMSRFSNEKHTPPAAGPTSNTTSNTSSAQGKAPAANGRGNQPNGQPVARTKAQDGEQDCADSASVDATTDPAAVAAAVAESAQLAAQNPALAAAINAVAMATANKDLRDDKSGTAGSTSALDVLAGQTSVIAGRGAEKTIADARALATAAATNEDVNPGASGTAPNRRTPVGAKDTLRIDAPAARMQDATKGDFADRLTAVTNAVAQATAHTSASATQAADMTPPAIAAAVSGGNNASATYSIAHAAVAAPVGSAGFASELSQRVVVFAGQKVQRAEISVTPADLGPIAVSIEVRGQEATLAFAASSHATRTAIEDALPRLREMLSAQGLQLAGTHVGSEPRRDPYRPAREEKGQSGGTRREGVAVGPVGAPATRQTPRGRNLIDIEV